MTRIHNPRSSGYLGSARLIYFSRAVNRYGEKNRGCAPNPHIKTSRLIRISGDPFKNHIRTPASEYNIGNFQTSRNRETLRKRRAGIRCAAKKHALALFQMYSPRRVIFSAQGLGLRQSQNRHNVLPENRHLADITGIYERNQGQRTNQNQNRDGYKGLKEGKTIRAFARKNAQSTNSFVILVCLCFVFYLGFGHVCVL